jgi:hypothetical protein
MSHDPNRVKIELRDNGLHSLWKGIAAYESAKTDDADVWIFKDAIMFIHHGVELLMKQILVNHSEYLVFEDLSETTVKKQKQAKKEKIGVFSLLKPPRSVTYSNAIRRVEAFIAPPELDVSLIDRLDELNNLRNQIEHYAVDIDKQDVTELLGKIHEPLLALLDSQLGGIRKAQPVPVIKAWESMTSGMERGIAAENRVAEIAACFVGQVVKEDLFTTDHQVTLPRVVQVQQGSRWEDSDREFEIDVVVESDSEKWAVEVKASQRLRRETFHQIKSIAHTVNATPWLVFLGSSTAQDVRSAHELGVLLTDGIQLDALEQLVKKG